MIMENGCPGRRSLILFQEGDFRMNRYSIACAALLMWAGPCLANLVLVAETGFNDATGINSNPTPNSPYELDADLFGQAVGEQPQWLGTWTVSDPGKFSAQSAITFEGDGTLHANRTAQGWRQWAVPQSEVFTVEYRVRFTENSRTIFYLENNSHDFINQGPVWHAFPGGEITVNDGVGDGCGTGDCDVEDTGFQWSADTWYKVKLIVDVPDQTYRFFLNDVEYAAPDPLGFRGTPGQINRIRFLAEVSGNGTYIDELRIFGVPEPSALILLGCGGIMLIRRRWATPSVS